MTPHGARIFSPANPDLAYILGRKDLDFKNCYFGDLSDPKILDVQVPRFPNSQISRFPDFQTTPAPDEFSDLNLTPFQIHPGTPHGPPRDTLCAPRDPLGCLQERHKADEIPARGPNFSERLRSGQLLSWGNPRVFGFDYEVDTRSMTTTTAQTDTLVSPKAARSGSAASAVRPFNTK